MLDDSLAMCFHRLFLQFMDLLALIDSCVVAKMAIPSMHYRV